MGKDLALLYELSLQKLTYSLLGGKSGRGVETQKIKQSIQFPSE